MDVTVLCRNLRFWPKNASGVFLSRDYFHFIRRLRQRKTIRGSFLEDFFESGNRWRAKSEFFAGKSVSGPLDFAGSEYGDRDGDMWSGRLV